MTAQAPDRVLLLHGVLRSAASMRHMERALVAAGHQVLNLNYPARRLPLASLAEAVHREAGTFLSQHGGRTHVVAHSLGALVARVLADQYPPPGLGRMVLIGPPNEGSELADLLSGIAPYRWIFGPAGAQLVTRRDPTLQALLRTAPCPVGVIAGTRSLDPLGWLLLPRPNDGRVAVTRTRLPGMTDHLVLPVTHTLMVRSPTVIVQTLHFLRHGRFRRSEQDARAG